MYSVVQFIENQKFKVMAVPSTWIKKNQLSWPKLSNSRIEALRTSGEEYDGPAKRIAVIVVKKFKNLQMAEAAAEDLSKREVSDVENKRKRLKPEKKPKMKSTTDYNAMVDACNRSYQLIPDAEANLAAEQGTSGKLKTQPAVPPESGDVSSNPERNVPALHSSIAASLIPPNAVLNAVSQALAASNDAAELVERKDTMMMQAKVQQMPSGSCNEIPMITVPMEQPSVTTKLLTGLSPTQPNVDSEHIYIDNEEVIYLTSQVATDPMANLQIAGAISYDPDPDDTAENHIRINTEEELCRWNKKLNSKELRQRYLEYFSKIIIPEAYSGKGDNACYTAVDCLFTRDFWTKMTWTGISRSNKAKQGFREYGNVIQLLCSIVQIGDPTYTATKFEMFCRNRLFRYCKSRSTSRQLRKSACRKRRGKKANLDESSIESDDSEDEEEDGSDSEDDGADDEQEEQDQVNA